MLHNCRMDDNVEELWVEAVMREAGLAAHTGIAREQSAWAKLSSEVDGYGATADD